MPVPDRGHRLAGPGPATPGSGGRSRFPPPPGRAGDGDGGAGDGDGDGGAGEPARSVFAALADPTRRSLLDHLSSDGPLTATQLSGRYHVSRQALTKHLAALSSAGLVETERRGREVFYGISAGPLRAATSWLDTVGRRWDERLDALQRTLGGAPGDPAGPGPGISR